LKTAAGPPFVRTSKDKLCEAPDSSCFLPFLRYGSTKKDVFGNDDLPIRRWRIPYRSGSEELLNINWEMSMKEIESSQRL